MYISLIKVDIGLHHLLLDILAIETHSWSGSLLYVGYYKTSWEFDCLFLHSLFKWALQKLGESRKNLP